MIELRQTPTFKRAYKKLRDNERKDVNATIRYIIDHPEAGELKTATWQALECISFVCMTNKYYWHMSAMAKR